MIQADHIKNSRAAFHSALEAIDALAHAMAEAEAPNGEVAYAMHARSARQALLEAVAALDGRLRSGTTLPALPTMPRPTMEIR